MPSVLVAASAAGGTASSDITASAGTPVTLFLNSGTSQSLPDDARATIEIKNTGGQYFVVGEMNKANPAKVIDGPGVYRVTKTAGGSYAIDQG